jgi:UDPglucose--hexose-1-phosphate uridylyltransferase
MDMRNRGDYMIIYSVIEGIVAYAIDKNLIYKEDKIYARNQIMLLLNLNHYIEEEPMKESIYSLLEHVLKYACENNIIEDIFDEKEILSAKVMNVFLSKPSEINKTFKEKYEKRPKAATNYFYKLSEDINYIQTDRIAKNISYKVETEYGNIDITINLSKPEKDPKAIAKQKDIKSNNYPKCLLCMENIGYSGKIGYPARSNHRVVNIQLDGETWGIQYSPYLYYNEHCIVLSEEHRDMKINKASFIKILSFVEKFPHYFLGSNADLPIVGGSILSHDHYQGGMYKFAMEIAEDEFIFNIPAYSNVKASILKWPMSVIRLKCDNIDDLISTGDYILNNWRNYSDASVDIIAFTDETPHNTITPIARKRNNLYELDLVLRNNRTTDQYPDGIFHPHNDVHHIKKENIGLIEVLGLAILPDRLKEELKEVEKFVIGLPNAIKDYHFEWAKFILNKYKNEANNNNIEQIVRDEVGRKFVSVLEDSGVFKRTLNGKEAFKVFINQL